MITSSKLGESHKILGKVVGFKNENDRRPIFEAVKEIKVKIIDWKPLIEKIKSGHESLKDMNLEIRSGNGIIFVPDLDRQERLKPVLIDDECCGVDGEAKNMLIDGKMMSGMFICGIGVFINKKNEGFISMMPHFYIDFDLFDIEACFTGEEKELCDFMGSRYLYNPRIENNMLEMVKLYKGIETKKRK